MTLFGSFGGFFFKSSTKVQKLYLTLFNKNFYLGILFYLIGAILNILALKYMSYTVVLPMTSITYVWSIILSVVIMKEKLTSKKIIGIISIVIGATFIGLF